MNFYIGNSINEIDISDDNIEFSDELIDFIYKLSIQTSYHMDELYKINPYDDIEISNMDLPRIIEISNYILSEALLESYEKQDEGNRMLTDLINIAQKALKKGLGLVSIGD